MKENLRRNGKIDFLRFLFALFIMFLHFGYRPSITIAGFTLSLGLNGGFAVNFFFVLSGYLLAMSIEKMSLKDESTVSEERISLGDQTVSFMKKKYRYYMRWYLPAFILCALLDVLKCGIIPVVINCIYSIPNLLLLGSLGFSSDANSIGYYVGASWFISTLFCSQFVLFPVMKYNYKAWMKIFAPVFFLITTYLNVSGYGGMFSLGFSDLILGGFCYETVKWLSRKEYKRWIVLFYKIVELSIFVLCCIYMCMRSVDGSAFGMTLLAAGGIIISFLPQTHSDFYSHPLFSFLGKISFPLYLLHIQILKWGEYIFSLTGFPLSDRWKYPILYVVAILISVLAYLASEWIRSSVRHQIGT